jgi:hypothetical protein
MSQVFIDDIGSKSHAWKEILQYFKVQLSLLILILDSHTTYPKQQQITYYITQENKNYVSGKSP